ncbi:MAG TPA: serine/threonine-protein kinase [Myxococcaceae bacterium]|jgi:non-specific serine/threonine protein kinase/serine/threonine-protein kinase
MSKVTIGLGDTEPPSGVPLPRVATSFDGLFLERRLGEGGMGEVWLAEQQEPIRRPVAVKIIKAGMDTKEVIARFESERQALALMDHPAIARIWGGGRTPEGRPYFVMEYVDGQAIDAHCDHDRLSLAERIELLIEVCEGVQHAHQKAVIHRDLKPSNMLMSSVNGRAQPKVIDFGIAKAIGHRLTQRTLLTEIGAVIGTPEYMSPEQADSSGQDVDTRTDVYSLGVVLYQLVTGLLPFSSRELRAGTDEDLRRKLREVDPPRPSIQVSNAPLEAVLARSSDRETLRRQVRGDLDAIILKALEKERSARYGTVAELAEDLRRYLRNEPVVARAPSTPYRIRKYLRRHALGVGIASSLVLLLSAFAVTTAVQARRVARERDRANAEAAAAQRVSAFLTSMFQVSDPSESRGNTITAREVLDRAAADVRSALAQQPELQARMMATLAQVYRGLGLYPQSHALDESALDIRRQLLGSVAPDTLESVLSLASVLREEGRATEAEALLRPALETVDRISGPESSLALRMRWTLSWILTNVGKLAEAETLARQSLATMERVLGPEHPLTWKTRASLAINLTVQHRYAEAVEINRQILAEYERNLGSDAPDTLIALGNLAGNLSNVGRREEALPLMRDLVSREERVFGPEHSRTLLTLDNLVLTLKWTKRLDEADTLARQVTETTRRVLGPEHPHTLLAMDHLALICKDRGQFLEAERLEREVLAVRVRVLGVDHHETAIARYNVACILAMAGKPAEALQALRDALDHGLHPRVAAGIGEDSDLRSLQGDPRFQSLVAEGRAPAPSR